MYRHPHIASFERLGIYFPEARDMIKPDWKHDYRLAMDAAQPGLVSIQSSAVPSIYTTFIDPEIYRVLLSPLEATAIFPEERKGTWLDQTVMFQVVERTGVVSSYGDHSNNGTAGINVNWINRQVYNYQTFIEYGDMEMERAGLYRLALASEYKEAAVWTLNNYQNLTYFYGVNGLAIYGILNDPSLPAPIAPSLKAYGNNRWVTGNTVTAAALEIYADILGLFIQVVRQSNGLIKRDSDLVLAFSPAVAPALEQIVQFGLSVSDMVKKAFPKIEFVEAVQYGASNSSNPQGSAVGEVVQLIAKTVMGQKTGICAFPEKLRAFPLVRAHSSYSQKFMQGTEGSVIRQPWAIAQMVGV